MGASDSLTDTQKRQLAFDLEQAYGQFQQKLRAK